MINSTEAEKLAFEFLTSEWHVPAEDRNWFTVLSTRTLGEDGYDVEIGIDGFPDRWIVEVYDTGKCEPCYEFSSPIRGSESNSDLEELPDWIAQVLMAERKQR
ncbi:MAG: hypothetical protein ACFB4I_10655 [Cyanophyceae cyanobacterium]